MKENSNKNRLDESSTNESSKNDKSVPNEENNIKEDLIGRTLFGKYKVIKKIAEGTQSTIYSGENIKTGEGIAIKTEKKNDNTCLLEQEINILIKLKQHEGIVNLISCGKRKNNLILIEKLLGKSLDVLFLDSSKKFTLPDICQIAIQCLDRLEYIHSKEIIHCDIKPENFAIGIKDPNVIYLIDFGLCQDYIDIKTGKHKNFRFTGYMTGTARYASRNALKGNQLSRRDDVESFIFMILYFLSKKLPWQGTRAKTLTARYKKIYLAKKDFKYHDFCKNYPKEIVQCIEYIYFLKFNEKPNYEYMRKLFKKILKDINFPKKDYFSWMENMQNLETIRKRAHSETKTKIAEQKKKIHSSILKISTIDNLKQSTAAVSNMKLSKLGIESTVILGESQGADFQNENKENIQDDNLDDFIPDDNKDIFNNMKEVDEFPIEDKKEEKEEKDEIFENEDKEECSENQNKLFSTEAKFKQELEQYPDDEDRKNQLKKSLEIIKEANEEDEEDIDTMTKKRGGSEHVSINNMVDEYKYDISGFIRKNSEIVPEKENNKIIINKDKITENINSNSVEKKDINQNKIEDIKKIENNEKINKNKIEPNNLIKKEEIIIKEEKKENYIKTEETNDKNLSLDKANIKVIKTEKNKDAKSNSFSTTRITNNKLKDMNNKIFNNSGKKENKKIIYTDDKIKYSSIGSNNYNQIKKGNNTLREKNKNCNII